MNNLHFTHVSEYVIHIESSIEPDLLRSLSTSINTPGHITENLQESDLEQLADYQSQIFRKYNADVMPDVLINDEKNAYSLELDVLNIQPPASDLINLGGEGRSQRFAAVIFVLGDKDNGGKITFESDDKVIFCKAGDILITPPYFSHRFTIEPMNKGPFLSINLYPSMKC